MKRVLPAMVTLFAVAATPLPTERQLTALERAELAAWIARPLKDPDSALFEWWPVRDNYILCGRINAKNGYGGYVGYRIFIIFMDKTAPKIVPEVSSRPHYLDEDSYMTRTWLSQCAKVYPDKMSE